MQTATTDRQFDTTHSPVCWSWGPRHYECALREIERLRAEVEYVSAVLREQRQHDEFLLRRALAALERGMLNTGLGMDVAAVIRERLHDKLSTYREVASTAIAKVELEQKT